MFKKIATLFLLLFSMYSFSQNENPDIKVFVDCNICDITYIKQNLSKVEFVRDQNFADVHLFFTTQRTGSDGRAYEIEFIGKNKFKDVQEKLSFSTNTNMSDDDIRQKTLKFIKLGLVRYWLKNGVTEGISITVKSPKTEEEKDVNDPWDRWVFRIAANGWFSGQESSKFSNLNFNISAKRVTEKNKLSIIVGLNESKSVFEFDGDEIISIKKSSFLNASDIVSINNQWSAGIFARLGKSVYSNKAFYLELSPAIEYNFFDYKESAKKQLVLSYKIGSVHNKYFETTIFNEDKELLFEHSLSLGGSVNQKWGNISGELAYEQFLHDTALNSLSMFLGANLKLFKGFSLNLHGSYSIDSNQINLPAGDVSLEELLLQQQQLKSGYNYFFTVGLSYSFGSIYNTIVNPRFNF